jgi:hypothetical protein
MGDWDEQETQGDFLVKSRTSYGSNINLLSTLSASRETQHDGTASRPCTSHATQGGNSGNEYWRYFPAFEAG